MKQIQMNSKELKRVTKNLQLENMSLHPSLQKKAVSLVNSGIDITPSVIKKALQNGKV
ncbi:Zn-dependent hydrolase [Rummeliibacillus pycnus]|uniref:Zn-dependent hydrolase n=1 Tax=Rummeliibacillus pycnus TaxID=101070 RepID=UPI002C8B176E|nr:Zn-dependent hydrolase [Rummeliibacillus sp.]